MSIGTARLRLAALHLSLSLFVLPLAISPALAQAPAAAPARATPQRGTVKAIGQNTLTITTDAGQEVGIAVAPSTRIQRLAAGSTDLKTAEAATLADVAVGDRVLVTGAPGETPASFTASRVILMKSADIAQRHEAEQQDWQKRGTGGIVSAVDAATGAITVSAGTRKLDVLTTPGTIYRRYADGSVKFEDAKPGTLAQIQTGDQMLARGARIEDGSSLKAEEIVSGSFKNLSGTLLSIDSTANTVSLKDLVTKRNVTVHLTPNSALHRLPPEAATRLAARAHAGGPAGAAPSAAGSARPTATPATPAGDTVPAGAHPAGAGHQDGHQDGHQGGGGDLAQVVSRLPPVAASDLHPGDAVLIVAEQSSADTSNLTAITLLAGVEPILAAAPNGSAATTLSPWSVGSGAPEGGGAQ